MSLQELAEIAHSVQQAGERFFDELVERLADLLAVSRAEIWETTGVEGSPWRVLAVWDRRPGIHPQQNLACPDLKVLQNQQIVRQEAGYVATPLVGATGRVLGCLALLEDRPLDASRQPELVARLFAPLAAAEIARRQAAGATPEPRRPPEDLLVAAIHELRDPLGGLVNAADVLHQTAGLDQQAQWAAEVVERQTRALIALMDDLTTAADLDRGKLEVQFGSLDLEQVIRQAIDAVRPALALRRQELRLETALDPLPVWGDQAHLRHALTRLLEGAVRATGVGSVLLLSAHADAGQVVVRLSGPPDAAGSARSLTDRRLGLIVVHRLVALHGGTLAAGPGGPEGALDIELQLPAVAIGPIRTERRTQPPGDAGPSRPSRRVLVVDDEYDSALALGMALERRGHKVHIVHNGRAALEALPRFQPDAVLLDIGLPGASGLDVARSIRAMPDHAHLTLIAATGFGWSDDRQRSLQAGFDHHLVKPLALEDIEAALAHLRSGKAAPVVIGS